MNFNKLPKDLKKYLFLDFNLTDTYNIFLTNQSIKNIFDDLFWMNKLLLDYGKYNHIPKNLIKKCENYENHENKKIIWKEYYKNLTKAIYVITCSLLMCVNNINIEKTHVKKINNLITYWCNHEKNNKIIKVMLNDNRINLEKIGNFCLKRAIQKNNIELVRIVLNQKFTINNDLNNPVRLSIEINNIKITKMLLDDKRIDPSGDNNSALMYSVEYNKMKYIKLLLEQKLTVKNNKILLISMKWSCTNSFKLLLHSNLFDMGDHKVLISSLISNGNVKLKLILTYYKNNKIYITEEKIKEIYDIVLNSINNNINNDINVNYYGWENFYILIDFFNLYRYL